VERKRVQTDETPEWRRGNYGDDGRRKEDETRSRSEGELERREGEQREKFIGA
jgi:hypothetical protein